MEQSGIDDVSVSLAGAQLDGLTGATFVDLGITDRFGDIEKGVEPIYSRNGAFATSATARNGHGHPEVFIKSYVKKDCPIHTTRYSTMRTDTNLAITPRQ